MGFNTNGLTVFHKPWFVGTPVNAVKGSINIGSGENGIVTIYSDLVGTEGNSYTITVSDAGANDCDMSASISGTDITVVLGKTVAALEPTKNTAILIAAAIDALAGVNAVHSGTGADSIGAAVAKTNFTGGKYATPCNASGALIVLEGTIYYTDKPCDKWTQDAWYSCVATVI